MNRRNFLKSLVAGVVGLAVSPNITPIFTELVDVGPVGDFEYYIKYQWKMYVLNPRACCIITNIEEP